MATRKIVIEVEVPEGGGIESLAAAEDVAFGVAQQAFAQILQQLAQEREAREQQAGEVVCPECGSRQVRRKGPRGRELYTRMGAVQLRRQRCQCQVCGHVFFPPGGSLGPAGGGAVDLAG